MCAPPPGGYAETMNRRPGRRDPEPSSRSREVVAARRAQARLRDRGWPPEWIERLSWCHEDPWTLPELEQLSEALSTGVQDPSGVRGAPHQDEQPPHGRGRRRVPRRQLRALAHTFSQMPLQTQWCEQQAARWREEAAALQLDPDFWLALRWRHDLSRYDELLLALRGAPDGAALYAAVWVRLCAQAPASLQGALRAQAASRGIVLPDDLALAACG